MNHLDNIESPDWKVYKISLWQRFKNWRRHRRFNKLVKRCCIKGAHTGRVVSGVNVGGWQGRVAITYSGDPESFCILPDIRPGASK